MSSTQAKDRNCVNMAKRGLIGEKIPLFFVESPDVQLPGAGRFVNIN